MYCLLAIGLFCGGLAACAVPSPFPVPSLGTAPGDLTADRERAIANTRHALAITCRTRSASTRSVESDAIPFARYPDLVRPHRSSCALSIRRRSIAAC